jgi:DNA-binding ferritin-like protein
LTSIQKLLNFQNEIKLHHWGTTSYAKHKALGKLYENIDSLLDTFTESYLGTYGKEEINEIETLSFNGPSKTTPENVLDSFEDYLMNELPKEIESNQTSLLNIRDEMLASVQQTKYLLTLS